MTKARAKAKAKKMSALNYTEQAAPRENGTYVGPAQG
jgi:hypothetical protein